jgi:hypothetical protein
LIHQIKKETKMNAPRFTLEYDEDFGRYELVSWTASANGGRGEVLSKHYSETAGLEALEDAMVMAEAEQRELFDTGSEFDDMDGDHASALASVGWGTDEDYGSFSDMEEY